VTETATVGGRPGDDFNDRGNWFKILKPHGWIFSYTAQGVSYWRRPGKRDPGHSATTNYEDLDLLHVFTTSATPFEAGRSYSKFHAYSLLNFDGDFSLAASMLRLDGFGGRSGFLMLEETADPYVAICLDPATQRIRNRAE